MRPEDISTTDYDVIHEACRADGAQSSYNRLGDYVCDLERYADYLEEQLSLESRQAVIEPPAVHDDISTLKGEITSLQGLVAETFGRLDTANARVKELEGSVGSLTSELAGAQARLFSIGLLTR